MHLPHTAQYTRITSVCVCVHETGWRVATWKYCTTPSLTSTSCTSMRAAYCPSSLPTAASGSSPPARTTSSTPGELLMGPAFSRSGARLNVLGRLRGGRGGWVSVCVCGCGCGRACVAEREIKVSVDFLERESVHGGERGGER